MYGDKDKIKLEHMLNACRKAVVFIDGRQRLDLDQDEKLSLALVRLLEIIGEAARGTSPELREQYPEIPWKQIAGTRDRLIHGYFDVDLDIVWEIVASDIPVLIPQIEKIISIEFHE